jgi:predicted DNA-binding transcriptional regulator AlpA
MPTTLNPLDPGVKPDTDPLQLLSTRKLTALLGCHPVTIWRLRRSEPDFPPAIQLSPGRVAFRRRDVEAFIASRSSR